MRAIFALLSTLIVSLFVYGSEVCALSTTTITIGETSVLSTADGGNGNLLAAQNATLSQPATIESLSFYVTQASGNLILGIYDASGPNGGPGALKAQTNSFTPVVGWNTANVITPVSLPAGSYWLAYLPSSNSLAFVKGQASGVSIRYYSYAFGVLPATFSTSPGSDPNHWSFYATLNPAPTISSVSLSKNSFTAGAPSGTVVGSISVNMSSGSFTGSLSLSGANASDFKIVGSNLETNAVLPAGSYSIKIVATQSGAANSPFTQAETITAVSQSISSVSLSNASFVGGSPSGTVVGTINVTMSPSTPAFSGSLSLSTTQGGCTATKGANNSSFAVSGSNLVTNGTVAPGTYAVCILATQASASNSPVGQSETLAGSSTTITIGETNILSGGVTGDANLLFAQSTTLSQTATIESLSIYDAGVTGTANVRLGIYADNGSGAPGALQAQTNSFAVTTAGWQTARVTTPIALNPGTYWLAWLTDNNSLDVPGVTTGTDEFYSFTFGAMPSTYAGTTPETAHRSLYATLVPSASTPQSIASVAPSKSSFVGGAPSGTVVGTINVAMSPSSPAFSGALSLSTTQGGCTATNGANNSSFAISGGNLVTNGTVAAGTYAICVLATQPGATNSPFGQAATITGSSQSIASVSLSKSSLVGGAPSGTVVGAINVAMSPSSPAFSGSLSLSTTQGGCTATNGANNSSFAISGSNLVTNGTVAPGTYAVCILATQAGATNSPFGQAETITGSSGGGSPFTFVNGVFGAGGTSTPATSASGTISNVVAGNGLIVSVSGCYTNGACTTTGSPTTSPVSSVGDTLGSTCSAVPNTYNGAQTTLLQMWLCLPTSSGSDTINVNFSQGMTYTLVQISQFSGFAASPNDSAANTTATGSGASASITTAAPTATSGELIYSTINNSAGAWVAGQTAAFGSGTNQLAEYQIGSSSASYTNTATGGGSGTWFATLAAFKPSGSPSIAGVTLTGSGCSGTNCSFTGNQSAGSTIGTLSARLNSGSFTGSFATSTSAINCTGTNGVNNNLFTVGAGSNPTVTVASGQTLTTGNTYAFCVAATQSGATNSPLGQPFTVRVSATSASEETAFIDPSSPSWLSVTSSSFGASCTTANNGSTDATDCIQNAIETAANNTSTPVVYFPAGTYNINPPSCNATGTSGTNTITVSGCSGASIVNGMNVLSTNTSLPAGVWVTGVTGSTITLAMNLTGSLSSVPVIFATGINEGQGLHLVGHSPSDTTISWHGPAGGTMMYSNGMLNLEVSRLNFDGRNIAGVAFNEAETYNQGGACCAIVSGRGTGQNAPNFDQENEYEDDIFQNTVADSGGHQNGGFVCGFSGYQGTSQAGCQSIFFVRSQFLNNAANGIVIGNNNAIDIDAFYSTFNNNRYGTNAGKRDGFDGGCCINTYNSNFSGNTIDNATWTFPPGYQGHIGDFSSGSGQFFNNQLQAYGGSATALINNTILNTTQPAAIANTSWGPLIAVGNKIQQKSGNSGSVITSASGNSGASLLSAGNTFAPSTVGTVTLGCTNASGAPVQSDGPCHEITGTGGDTVTSSVTGTPPTYTTPSIFTGSSVEVSSGSGCGTAINNAISTLGSAGGVVHVQAGTCTVGSVITIPANVPIQIIGDGYYTQLSWGGASGGNMIRCGGTTGSANVCKATFKYFNMVGNSPNGMLINNADGNSTTAGRIMMVQPVVQNAAGNNSLTVNGLNYTTVTDYDGIFQYSTGTGTAITVSNGGGSATGAFNKFGGLSSGNLHFYSVSGGANAEFFAVWHDGNASPECDAGTASGAGNFTYALGQLSIGGSAGCSTVPEITLSNFTGKAYLAGPSIQEIERDSDIAVNLQITGSSGAGSVLAQITATSSTPYTNSGGASLAVLNSAHCATCSTGPVFSLLPESPSSFACPSATCTLITNNMTQLANTGPPPVGQTSLPAGVTDVLMDHIFAGGANLAIDIEH